MPGCDKRNEKYIAEMNNDQPKNSPLTWDFYQKGDFQGLIFKDDLSGRQELSKENRRMMHNENSISTLDHLVGLIPKLRKSDQERWMAPLAGLE